MEWQVRQALLNAICGSAARAAVMAAKSAIVGTMNWTNAM
jgi:hypothetical protein